MKNLKEELFDFYKYSDIGNPILKKRYLKKCVFKSFLILPFIVLILLYNAYKRYKSPIGKIKYIFVGTFTKDIFQALPKDEIYIFASIKDRWLNTYNYSIYEFLYPLICCVYYLGLNDLIGTKGIQRLIRQNPNAVIITGNDNKPLERIFIKIAHQQNRIGITIQHGLWVMNKIEPYQVDGWYSDKILVYDQFHKELLMKLGMSESKIVKLGFPKKPIESREVKCNDDVCIIGLGFSVINKRQEATLANNAIYDALIKGGFKNIWYKPHPSERKIEIERDVNVFKGSMVEAINCFQYYVGGASTSLIELVLSGKDVLQFFAPSLKALNFEDIGYVKSVDFRIRKISKTSFERIFNTQYEFEEVVERFKRIAEE